MLHPRIVIAAVTASFCFFSPAAVPYDFTAGTETILLARLDADEARELKQSGQIMSLESLLAQMRDEYPGQIIEIQLDDKRDRYIYEIELVTDDGVVIELEIDAATGEMLKFEKDY